MAYCWDLETNVRQQKTFVVEHLRKARGQLTVLTDPRDVYELTANQGARRLRACILGVIPGDVIDAALGQCQLTLKHSMKAPEEEIRLMIKAFAKYGVDEPAVMKRLGGKALKAVTAAEVIRMRTIFVSIRDNMSAPGDWFDLTDSANAGPGDDTTKAVQELKDKLEENAKNAPEDRRKSPFEDAKGDAFDPDFHVWDEETQEPVYNKGGEFRRRPQKMIDTVED